MSANNISEKQILSYIVSTFSYWGIEGITEETIKHAKKNHSNSVKQMKRLLLNLTILHMFSYQINLSTYIPLSNPIYQLSTEINESEIDEIIMAYLTQCECPLLLEMKNANKLYQQQQGKVQTQYFMGCNLQSSRTLLLLCGWVMAVSDYFNQIHNLLQHKLNLIQNPQPQFNSKAIQNLIQNKLKTASQSSLLPQSVTTLYKSIQTRLYSTECYQKKLQKIKLKLNQEFLKTYHLNIPIDSLFASSTSPLKQQKLEEELYAIITNEILNMGQRKYFWIWLEEKIIKQTENDLKTNHPNYTQYLQEDHLILYNAIVDLQYLPKYIELCQYYDDKYQQLNNRLNPIKLSIKKNKQIDSQVQHQFRQTLQNHNQNPNRKKLFFIALQLKNHLNVKPNQKPTINQSLNDNDAQIKTNQITKKLKKQLKNYLQSIQDAINFI